MTYHSYECNNLYMNVRYKKNNLTIKHLKFFMIIFCKFNLSLFFYYTINFHSNGFICDLNLPIPIYLICSTSSRFLGILNMVT